MGQIAVAVKAALPDILERIAQGEYASAIAAEMGISPQILSWHLKQQPVWAEIMETAHEARLDAGTKLVDEAIGARDFELARARTEQLKRHEWRAERECPGRWAGKGGVSINLHGGASMLTDADLARIAAPLLTTDAMLNGSAPSTDDQSASITDVEAKPAAAQHRASTD